MFEELTSLWVFTKGIAITTLFAMLPVVGLRSALAEAPDASDAPFLIGWASADITPKLPVVLGGMPGARIATEVHDLLFATALVMEAVGQENGPVILISCDLRNISDALRDGVRKRLKDSLPQVSSDSVILNATHSHNAPPLADYGIYFEYPTEEAYSEFAAQRIASAAEEAWKKRSRGGISFGLSHAVIGQNRLIANRNGKSVMYGNVRTPDFSHVEGYEDHAVNLLCTWSPDQKLTGMVVNVAMPSQAGRMNKISADFWFETRTELRNRFGKDLFVLPQCSAAGDQSPRIMVNAKPEARMAELTGKSRCQIIADRLTAAIASIYPVMEQNIDWKPVFQHRAEMVPLTRRLISKEDAARALAEEKAERAIYESGMKGLLENPKLKEDAEWSKKVSRSYWNMNRGAKIEARLKLQQTEPKMKVELHLVRIGEMVMATNPFELYVDYGIRIKSRSRADQTFLVQLAGSGSYVPTARSIGGGAYGAVPESTLLGPEGGNDLVEWTVNSIEELWPAEGVTEMAKGATGKP